jgi:hypothetical protein
MGQGHLKFSDFRTLLDCNPEIHHVELSNYGEMFLNPQLTEILAYAFERGVTVSGGNGVNLNHAREEVPEAVVRYRVRTLTCSLDGATQQSCAKYRINGNLERVLRNIDRIRFSAMWKRTWRSARDGNLGAGGVEGVQPDTRIGGLPNGERFVRRRGEAGFGCGEVRRARRHIL